MASSLPPPKNAAFWFTTGLVSQADTDTFVAAPTMAAGDVQISKDAAQFANVTDLPTILDLASGADSGIIKVTLTATEMNADVVTVIFHDAAGDEWQDQVVTIYTAAQTLDATDGIADDIKATVNHATYGNSALETLVDGLEADTTEILTRIPDATPGANGGLPTVNASNQIAGIAGTKNTFDALNDITVANIIAGIAEGSLDLQEMLRIILAAVAGKVSGGGTSSIAYRDQADTKNRIVAIVDTSGNRSAVTVDGS